ncbi:MAG: histidine kinase [Actinomycetota bacterium]|nr:histidine kinase [Actinomycetota bacterium]
MDAKRATPAGPRAPTVPFRVLTCGLALGTGFFTVQGIPAVVQYPVSSLVWVAVISAANLLFVPIERGTRIEATLDAPVSIAAAVVLETPRAMLIMASALLSTRELQGSTTVWHVLFNHSHRSLAVGAASAVAGTPGTNFVLSTALAALAYEIVSITAISCYQLVQGGRPPVAALRDAAMPFPRFAADFVSATMLVLLVVVMYQGREVGLWALVLIAPLLMLAHNALQSAREAEDRAEELAARVRELEALNQLGSRLLTATRAEEVARIGTENLRTALASDRVELSLDAGARPSAHTVRVRGAPPTAIALGAPLDSRSQRVVEAVESLLGMALQRIRLDRELQENEQARAALSGQILEEGTRERSRIALQIHDQVLPYFAAAEIQTDNARTALARSDPQRAGVLTSAARAAVNDGIRELRDVLEALRRQVVVPGDLRAGVEKSLDQLRIESGVAGELKVIGSLPQLPLAVEILVLETVRGCLTNVGLHAKAGIAEVSIAATDGSLRVEVTDDGRGFDTSTVAPGHHGLALMAQRVELARGSFSVDSAVGGGTRVRLEVPL